MFSRKFNKINLNQDDHEDEIIELKREISHKTFQKRTSFTNLLSLFNLYESMADQNQDVFKFLKQTQHDFATIIAKVNFIIPIFSKLNIEDEKTRTCFIRNN